MPYFSFSLKKNFFSKYKSLSKIYTDIKEEEIYFSKSTPLWKDLNKIKKLDLINFIQYEKRYKVSNIGENVLFCLPPSIGLGDAIEYALAFRSLLLSKKLKNFGIGYTGNYKYIFEKYFRIKKIYKNYITKKEIDKFDTIFHLSLEINSIKHQKFNRTDIEKNIINYFKIKKKRFKKKYNNQEKFIKKITIFPISTSPIRSMPVNLIKEVINYFIDRYYIDIVFDFRSQISNYIDENLTEGRVQKLYPKKLKDLCNIIENIDYGIFMDSGPLHLAKILNKKGSLIVSSVNEKVLLSDFISIKPILNDYKSPFCNSPCGLTNIFNYNNNVGCYQSLCVSRDVVMKSYNHSKFQRGDLKKSYINLMTNPVGCLNTLKIKNLVNKINKDLEN